MPICIAAGMAALTLAADAFTLAWTHSVERTAWQEDWRVHGAALELVQARVRGSGAGMEPPEGAQLRDGWWVYRQPLTVPVLRLAVSGATVDGWRLCTADQGCRELESLLAGGDGAAATIEIRPGACVR
ncbi:MAG: DUF1850 domain-containing protein [Burkholderiaceae bacterium]|nr:DUF1850 domain-containing protein [Burkholderiaceae bacterium]